MCIRDSPYDLYLREHMAAQSNLGLDIPNIPTPGPGDSMWGINTLGEVLHYAPGLGWQIVNYRYGAQVAQPAGSIAIPASAWTTAVSLVVPRAGRIVATGHIVVDNSAHNVWVGGLAINGVNKTANNAVDVGNGGTATNLGGGPTSPMQTSSGNAVVTWTGDVTAGSVIAVQGITVGTTGAVRLANLEYTYLN
jgi:hypothetical protein